MDILINSIGQSANGTHKYVYASVDGGPEVFWSFDLKDLNRVSFDDPRDIFLKRLRMEWKERALGAFTPAKLSTLIVGKTFQI